MRGAEVLRRQLLLTRGGTQVGVWSCFVLATSPAARPGVVAVPCLVRTGTGIGPASNPHPGRFETEQVCDEPATKLPCNRQPTGNEPAANPQSTRIQTRCGRPNCHSWTEMVRKGRSWAAIGKWAERSLPPGSLGCSLLAGVRQDVPVDFALVLAPTCQPGEVPALDQLGRFAGTELDQRAEGLHLQHVLVGEGLEIRVAVGILLP